MTLSHSSTGSVHGRPSGARRQSRAGLAFVAAYVILLIAFGILPTGYAVCFAFTDAGGTFTGFSNFVGTAQHFRFLDSVGHVALYLVLWLVSLVVFEAGAGPAAAPSGLGHRRQVPATSPARTGD